MQPVIAATNGSTINADAALQPMLQFHAVRGKHVRLSANGSLARRVKSFRDGIAFSSRPVQPNDKVYVRVIESVDSWSGALWFGFTSVNPASLRDTLPKNVFPDLTNRSGFWGGLLPEQYHDVTGVVIAFYYTTRGDVMLTLDDTDEGVFLRRLDTRSPLWAMLDIYGKTTAVQFIHPPRHLSNNNPIRYSSARRRRSRLHSSHTSGGVSSTENSSQQLTRLRDLLDSMNSLDLSPATRLPSLPLPPNPAAPSVNENFPPSLPITHYRHHAFKPLTLHPCTHGVNIRMGSDCLTAMRTDANFRNGYVMSSRPIIPGESWVVQIVQTEPIFLGGMGFGLTTCNPASLSPADLPDDAGQLLDRPEYWVISEDVAHSPLLCDEIEFYLARSGEVTMRRNCGPAALLMHVDVSLPLWTVFDVYGSTKAIRLLGTIVPPSDEQHQPISSGTASSYVNVQLQASTSGTSSECIVCCERSVDCVLYSCGHMCVCYDCARTLHTGERSSGTTAGVCPICRASIRDVIRVYRS